MNTHLALPDKNGPVIVFDGMWLLCSANAHFVLSHDKAKRCRFAAMQGDYGQMIASATALTTWQTQKPPSPV